MADKINPKSQTTTHEMTQKKNPFNPYVESQILSIKMIALSLFIVLAGIACLTQGTHFLDLGSSTSKILGGALTGTGLTAALLVGWASKHLFISQRDANKTT